MVRYRERVVKQGREKFAIYTHFVSGGRGECACGIVFESTKLPHKNLTTNANIQYTPTHAV